MDASVLVFTLAAIALLGSPGPGIAALIAVGKTIGLAGGIRFLAAMQVGLALAAGLSALGLAGILEAMPMAHTLLAIVSVGYLLWLAWRIAAAPVVGEIADPNQVGKFRTSSGFILGIANPKGYLAFASLFGSFVVLQPAFGTTDTLTKWAICVAVMIVVDFAWLAAGAGLGRIILSPRAERAMNVGMGGAILVACALSFL
ncbi:MAG: LysE family translocator [Phyllobacterium sp.]